jgi:hypothetical protein
MQFNSINISLGDETILGNIRAAISKIWSSSIDQPLLNSFSTTEAIHQINETFLSFIPNILVVSVISALSLIIGGWIAHCIIIMENRTNLIDG